MLEGIDGSFLTQVLEDPSRNGVLLNLILMNWEGLFGDRKVGSSLGDHEIVKFSTGCEGSRTASKIIGIYFRRDDFSVFGDVSGRIPWKKAPRGNGAPKSWLISKDHFQSCIRMMHSNK